MKNRRSCCLTTIAIVLFLFIVSPVFSQDKDLTGRWVGEWYSYAKSNTFHMQLDIVSMSPLKGEMYRSPKIPGKPRRHFASVEGEVKDGKVFFELTGPDGFSWKFELDLKENGRMLEGEGTTKTSPSMRGPAGRVNLRMVKAD